MNIPRGNNYHCIIAWVLTTPNNSIAEKGVVLVWMGVALQNRMGVVLVWMGVALQNRASLGFTSQIFYWNSNRWYFSLYSSCRIVWLLSSQVCTGHAQYKMIKHTCIIATSASCMLVFSWHVHLVSTGCCHGSASTPPPALCSLISSSHSHGVKTWLH